MPLRLICRDAIGDIFVRADSTDKGDWGATVNEALASGLPVVCTDALSSQVDLIRHGENGFVYSTGDIDALAAILRDLIDHRERLAEMNKRSREVMSDWGYDEDVQGVLDALKSCCGAQSI